MKGNLHRNSQNEFRRLFCAACGWSDDLDTEKIYRWLERIGKIRPGKEIEDEILYELFHGLAPGFLCVKCGASGLSLEVKRDDFSDFDARRCRGCAGIIPPMRLEYFPDAVFCAKCAEKREKGEKLPIDAEFCPRCGEMMELVPVRRENGKTEFVWRCVSVPSCRLR